MMNTNQYRIIRGMLWITARRHVYLVALVLTLVLALPFLARSAGASAQAAALAPTNDRWAAIDAYVEQERQAAHIPGVALGIVQGDRVVHLQGFGEADPSGRAVTPQTPFYIGSATKSMTAVAIMQLVEQGKLNLDAPIQRYLPWFTLADPTAAAQITVRHLLTHTSGLSRAIGLDVATNRNDLQDGGLERQVRAWHDAEAAAPAGTTFQYNNANYVILGLLVETLSGQSFESYFQQHIFVPLEMEDATVGPSPDAAQPVAVGYRYWFGVPHAAHRNYGRVINSAGGVIASAEEMTHYLIAQLNGGRYRDTQILAPSGTAELHRPQVPVPADASQGQGDEGVAYGLGWWTKTRTGMPVVAHPGDLPTYHADMQLLPEEQIGIVLLMNANDRLTGERMRAMINGVTSLMLGRQPASVETGGGVAVLIFRIVLGLAVLQLGLIGWSLRTLRRWSREPVRRPHGRLRLLLHALLPLGFHLLLALLFLVGLPTLFNLPLSLLMESTPDLGALAVGSGGIAIVWAVIKTVLMLHILYARGASPVGDVTVAA
jgi:CubicO group peptidase (beta-lactamase class C family)